MKELSDEQTKKIADSLLAGRKINAIKEYREVTGVGLKEAKEAIDELILSLSKEHPEIITANKSGCASVVLICFTLIGIGIYTTTRLIS